MIDINLSRRCALCIVSINTRKRGFSPLYPEETLQHQNQIWNHLRFHGFDNTKPQLLQRSRSNEEDECIIFVNQVAVIETSESSKVLDNFSHARLGVNESFELSIALTPAEVRSNQLNEPKPSDKVKETSQTGTT